MIVPPANATLDFVATVGGLYYQQEDHKNIAEKKILYFYEYLSSRFQIDAHHRGGDFMAQVAAGTGVPEELARKLFNAIDSIRKSRKISDDDLVSLNRRMEEFKHQVHAVSGASEDRTRHPPHRINC